MEERKIIMADKKQNLVKYGEVVAKCWEDEAYKKRFIEDPETVLSEAGFIVEEGVTYKVIEQPKMVKYIVLPHANAKEAVQTVAKIILNKVEQSDVIIPEGAEVRMVQNTDDVRYIILPMSPKMLSKQELAMAAGGNSDPNTVVEYTQTNVVTVQTVVEGVTVTTVGPSVEPTVSVVAVGIAVLI